MDPFTIGAIIAGVVTVASTVAGKIESRSERRYNSQQAAINREYQTNERLESQAFNVDMWNKANQYNSPAKQIQLGKQAGINPNAIIEGLSPGSVQPVSTSPMSGDSASLPSSFASSLMNLPSVFGDLFNSGADAVGKIDAHRLNKKLEDERLKELMTMNEERKANIAKIFRDISHTDFDESMQLKTFSWFSKKSEQEIKVMQQQLNLLRNQSYDVIKGIEVKDATIRNINEDTALKTEQRYTEVFKQRLTASQITNIDADTVGKEINNDLQQLQLEFSNITGLPAGTSENEALFFMWASGRFDDFLTLLSVQADDTMTTYDKRLLFENTVKLGQKYEGQSTGYNYNRKSPAYVNSYNQRNGYINPHKF